MRFRPQQIVAALSTPALSGWTLMLCLTGLALSGGWFAGLLEQARTSNWPTTNAVVLRSEIRWSEPFLSKRGHLLHFAYSYMVGLNGYESETIDRSLFAAYFFWPATKAEFSKSHPVGSSLTIAYDPARPGSATVRVGLSLWDFVPVVPVIASISYATILCASELSTRTRRGCRPPV